MNGHGGNSTFNQSATGARNLQGQEPLKSTYTRWGRYRKHTDNEKRDPPSKLVFPGRKGYLGDIRDGLDHACDKARVPRVTVHQLRHTCASLMVMRGSDLPSVAATLGHRDISTTMIHSHLTQEHIKKQMARLDEVSVPEICPKFAQNPLKKEKGKSAKSRFPLRFFGAEGRDNKIRGHPWPSRHLRIPARRRGAAFVPMMKRKRESYGWYDPSAPLDVHHGAEGGI